MKLTYPKDLYRANIDYDLTIAYNLGKDKYSTAYFISNNFTKFDYINANLPMTIFIKRLNE